MWAWKGFSALRRNPKNLHAKSHSSCYSFRDLSVHTDRRTSDFVKKYIYLMRSETLPSTCYILSDDLVYLLLYD